MGSASNYQQRMKEWMERNVDVHVDAFAYLCSSLFCANAKIEKGIPTHVLTPCLHNVARTERMASPTRFTDPCRTAIVSYILLNVYSTYCALQEKDMAFAGLTITSQRETVVDFSKPFWYETSSVAVHVRTPCMVVVDSWLGGSNPFLPFSKKRSLT